MLNILRKITPKPVLRFYHFILANLANFIYGFPSRKLIIIGVTGTNGKSTTVNLIARILEQAGQRVGFTTTINIKVGDKEWLNKSKMTMLGRFQLQKLLKQMVDAGCKYAVIETSSQGLIQHRHLGVEYDAAVFTNLTPEHIEAHGGFENYKKAKGLLFSHLTKFPNKIFNSKKIPKVIVANVDDEHADYFCGFIADEKWGYGIKGKSLPRGSLREKSKVKITIQNLKLVEAEKVELGPHGSRFLIRNLPFALNLFGECNVYNALAATAACLSCGLDLGDIAGALKTIKGIAGRMEFIDEGQNFKVLIDYAPEPASMGKLYETIRDSGFMIPDSKIIHVLGSAGGGRDKSRRPVLGRMAGEAADVVIVTNEDPYDEDPAEIIDQVAEGALAVGKVLDKNLFKILDRGQAIEKAINFAEPGDLVLLTGKGAEQAIVVAGGKKIPWDEREVAREALKKRNLESGSSNLEAGSKR